MQKQRYLIIQAIPVIYVNAILIEFREDYIWHLTPWYYNM